MRTLAMLVVVAVTACSTSASHVTIDRTDCYTCHTPEYAATNTDTVSTCRPPMAPRGHAAHQYGTGCADCHGTTAWCPADDKHTMFDITSTSHAGWDCADCHTAITYTPPNPAVTDPTVTGINCTNCHWHDEAQTDMRHLGKSGYVYGPATCLASNCHGDGRRQ